MTSIMLCLRSLTYAALFAAPAVLAVDNYRQLPFTLPGDTEQLLVVDADGDGLGDLLTVSDTEIRVYFQDAGRFDFQSGYQSLSLPGDAVGWDLSRGYPSNGESALSVIALVDGREVMLWRLRRDGVADPVVLLSGLNGFLTKGVNRLHLSRDVNDDGHDDLIIPGPGTLNLHIRDADGAYQPGIEVRTDVRMSTILSTGRLERETGQSLVIPLMELRDINADGVSDLVSRTEERLEVFLAGTGSRHFPSTPSYVVDIAEIEERLGEFDIDRLDFSNLTGILALTHEEILEDVNGDAIDDLLLREGGKVSLFTGTATGMNLDQPTQVLRSGGNVLSVFLFDEDEDGLKDLWLWRVEPISVGDVFLWLALSGSIAVEAFIYPNEGESFARRPARRITVNLKFPSALRLAGQAMDIARQAREGGDTPLPPNVNASLNDNPDREDLLVLAGNQLQVFMDVVEPVLRNDPFLDGLGYTRGRNDYEIDVRDILDNVSINGSTELAAVASREADFRVALDREPTSGDIVAVSLNEDGLDDILVFLQRDDVQITGLLLLSGL